MQTKPQTAGALLTPAYLLPVIHLGSSPDKLYQLLQTKAASFTSIDYIYLVDDKNHLRGVLSIREFFKNRHHSGFKKFLARPLISVLPELDQEQVSLLSLQHGLKSIPVISTHGVFLGAVLHDSLMNILHREATENLFSLSGITKNSHDDLLHASFWSSIKHRLPWLLIGLLGGLLTAQIISGFESSLSKNLVLVTFIPLVTYMASAVGTQMTALLIRDLAVNSHLSFLKYFFKQFLVVGAMGLVIGTLLFFLSHLIYKNLSISTILTVALLVAVFSSLFSGFIVPFLFHKFKQDPADASGPIATIIQDALSVYIYFLTASYFLN